MIDWWQLRHLARYVLGARQMGQLVRRKQSEFRMPVCTLMQLGHERFSNGSLSAADLPTGCAEVAARSSAESEFYSIVSVADEGFGVQSTLGGSGFQSVCLTILPDSSAGRERTSKFFFAQNLVMEKRVCTDDALGQDNPADLAKKCIPERCYSS